MPDSHLDAKSIVSGSGTRGGGRSSVSIRSGQGLDSDSGSLAGGGSGSSGVGKDKEKEKEKEKGTSQSQTSLEAMYQVRLLAALRSGEPSAIHPFLQELTARRGSSPEPSNETDPCALALHLAIRVASPATISLLLSYRAMDVNGVYPPGSGTTALHLAAGLGRVDVVGLLLDMEGVDDSRLDATGRGVRDVAKGSGVLKVIDDSRALLNASFRSLLHAYTLSPLSTPAPPALLALLSSPRAKLIDLSYVDEETGRGILHEAVRRNEMSVVEGCVRAGVDVFGRDKRGKGVLEGKVAHGGEGVRGYLRQYANASASLGAGGVGGGGATLHSTIGTSPRSRSSVQLGVGGYEEAPSMKGYLAKYTNVARGYNPRWFVLSNGVLSYYRTREEEGIASRGSLAMGGATVRFGGEKGSVTLTSSSTSTSTSTSSSMKRATRFEIWGGGQKWFVKAAHPAESARWVEGLVKSVEWAKRKDAGLLAPGSVHSNVGGGVGVGEKAMVDDDDYEEDDDEDDEDDDDEEEATPPHPDWPLTFNALKAQLDLVLPSSSPLLDELMKMMEEREGWFRKKLKREQKNNRVWEESLRSVVEEGEGLERELRRGYLGRRKRGRVPGRWEGEGGEEGEREGKLEEVDREVTEEKERGEKERKDPPPPLVLSPKSPKRPLVTRQDEDDEEDEEDDDDDGDEFFDAIESGNLPGLVVHESLKSPLVSPSLGGATPTRGDSFTQMHTPTGGGSGSPGVALSRRSTLSPGYPQGQGGGDEMGGGGGREVGGEGEDGGGILVPHEVYAPYEILRTRLPLEADDRPSTSLWSVLKGSIGKDLTRISFPVFFNEPTSMLQRMAEDMEFSGCLDVACEEGDAHRRIAFVAAFAMSNYSSTIGRIAKPFNPLLSETFEYCRLDPGHAYRYFSEQVSHHPPISACYAESEKRKGGRAWRYFGEVDAQNKFMGKSFEIRPTGVAHVELELGGGDESYMNKGGKGGGKEGGGGGGGKEHYTWKKVTTNVSGFILGSPTIDHYGDMVVTNHATGDRCVLTFKPRGWRGKDAYEISGSVVDGESGEVVYEIAGRWDDRLVARSSSFHSSSHSPSHPSSSTSQEYILLWQNSPKPPPGASPFNLTPFAITLNALPTSLVPLLPRTDSRKRPDQRAFEVGLWEKANELKGVLEERQRGVRREREMRLVGAGAGAGGHAHEHTPRWFVKSVDGDSGERVWEPKRVTSNGSGREVEYWYERARGEWEGVDEIFVEMPSEVEDRLRSVGEGM